MDKIKDLLKQLGISEEGIKGVLESLEEFRKTVESSAERKLTERLDAAKKVCIEEVDKEKAELRRKIEIFLEARVNTVTREAQKQAAIGESDSSKTLRELKALFEGVKLDGIPEDYQAVVAENKKLRAKLLESQEEVSHVAEKANRATTIAMNAIKHAKAMESKLKPAAPVTESKEKTEPAKLEDLRTDSQTPKTTRKTLVESQQSSKTQGSNGLTSDDPTINEIAGKLDGTPAFIG